MGAAANIGCPGVIENAGLMWLTLGLFAQRSSLCRPSFFIRIGALRNGFASAVAPEPACPSKKLVLIETQVLAELDAGKALRLASNAAARVDRWARSSLADPPASRILVSAEDVAPIDLSPFREMKSARIKKRAFVRLLRNEPSAIKVKISDDIPVRIHFLKALSATSIPITELHSVVSHPRLLDSGLEVLHRKDQLLHRTHRISP